MRRQTKSDIMTQNPGNIILHWKSFPYVLLLLTVLKIISIPGGLKFLNNRSMCWSPSSIPCQIYCAGHRVVLSNILCCVTNYPNHRINLGSLKLGSFLLGSLMQLKSDTPCIGWDCGYPKSWLSWMSQTTHSYSWQVMLHYWLGAQLGFSTWVAICDHTMRLGFLTARWPQIGLLTWHLRA